MDAGAHKGSLLYLLHVLRKRFEYPDLKRAVIEPAQLHGATKVLVEDASSGQALLQDLKNDGFYLVESIKPKGDKVMRFNSVSARIEAEQVFVPLQASWLEDYLTELMMFPAARHDNQVDSTSQALIYAFIFQGKNLGFMDMVREELREMRDGPTPCIRVNCDDKGMQFSLFGGRNPRREEDGSFLITKEEAVYMAPCLYRV